MATVTLPSLSSDASPHGEEDRNLVTEGAPAPDFTLTSDAGESVSLADFRGKTVVLYFFPKANTPG